MISSYDLQIRFRIHEDWYFYLCVSYWYFHQNNIPSEVSKVPSLCFTGWFWCWYYLTIRYTINSFLCFSHLAYKYIYMKVYIRCTYENVNIRFTEIWKYNTTWKVPKHRVVSGPHFPVFSPHFPVFSPNIGKYGPEKTPYLDTFQAVQSSSLSLCLSILNF